MKASKELAKFVKVECANFNQHYQICADDKPCKVLNGERCGYFEKSVLGPPDYKYRLPGRDYTKLFAQYAEHTGAESQRVQQRRCACGEPLSARQRCCEKCSQKRRKNSNRRYNQKRAG